MSPALFLTLTVHSMWKLRGIHGGKSRDSLNQSMGWERLSVCLVSRSAVSQGLWLTLTPSSLLSSGRGRVSRRPTPVACLWSASLHLMSPGLFTWATLSPTLSRTLWPDGRSRPQVLRLELIEALCLLGHTNTHTHKNRQPFLYTPSAIWMC